ncbi:ExeM/NucH family extracellular endonuclease [Cellulomonas sp. KRMCY2]|uniref:ExeM/NucH family extracellular endonuclease n=1 Tax=Cellulomonas sp. KRMCY2 TaxID=1304865 RepID=UPI00045EBAD4|nr:ExeM/NucH family extracellular endonuclease [Cellulomonas sp. KRMCY2]
MHTIRRSNPRHVSLTAISALCLVAVLVPPAAAADEATLLAATHTIAEVQGAGAATTIPGTTVTVEGVVTADHRTGGYKGIYVQTAGSGGVTDATPGASDGVFVYLNARTTAAQLGDLVSVTGVAAEYFGLTQINASGAADLVQVVGTGTVPAAVALPDTLLGADREQYEGMLVAPQGEYLVASTHEVDRYGTVWLTTGPALPVKSTELAPAGAEADAIAAQNAARRLLLDDGKNAQVTGATQPYLTAGDPVRTGDAAVLDGLPYVLHYGFDEWRLQPITPIDATTAAGAKASFTERNARTTAPADVLGDADGLVVAAFNVLNYFTTFSSVDADARGAVDQAQFDLQKPKILAAITALDADVVTLMEIENSVHFGDGTPDVALADLVAGLNGQAGSDVWAYAPTPAALVGAAAPATDVIMNAIIYRTDAVTPVGESTADVDETVWDIAREPIAQTFATVAGDGNEFTVVANHFKSKGGTGTEPADGQGFFNAERVEQAGAVVDFVAELQASTGVEDVAVMGDLNSYSHEDPIGVFAQAGFVDLVATHAAGQYTYTFDGELGSLDHALATPSFAARVIGADVWEINSPEWFGYQYYGSFPQAEAGTVYRSSDHDPILFGLADVVEPTVTIDLLGINDFHGRIKPNGVEAGAAVMAGAVNAFRAANPNTVFLSAGDNIGASTFESFVAQDQPTIDALNAAGLQVSAVGNHELDQGRVDLDDRVIPAVDFPYLAANLYDRATGEPAYDEYWVTDVDGVDVGFVGAVTEALPSLVTPAGIASLEVRPLVTEVNRVTAELSDGDATNGEADVIVVLVHEGPATSAIADSTGDSVFGQIVAGLDAQVDVVYSGHTHQAFIHQIPVVGWADGLTRPVVQSGQYGTNLAHVSLTVDTASGDVVANSAELVPLAPGGAAAFPADPAVKAIVDAAVADAAVLGRVSLGSITAALLRSYQADGVTENRGGESTLGNLVADAQLWAAGDLGAQIAFMNPGGMRANLAYASTGADDPDGNVTFKEAADVQPFANTLVTMTLTGDQVAQVLEEQWQPTGAQRPFLKLGVAGLTYTYDPTAAAGDRITRVLVGGTPIDPAGSYTVVVNSFLASGGDNFATLALGTGKADSGRIDLQAFVDYFAAKTPISPDLTQRSVGVHLDTPAGGYLPGATVTANLSSLVFSRMAVQPAEVTLSIDGTPVGTFPIDPAIVDTTDEQGRATATFAVPADATGETLEVVATVAGTGTTASFMLPLAAAPVPACAVTYDAFRLWPVTLLGAVTVTNTSAEAVQGWQLQWQFTKGEKAKLGLGAGIRQRGATVTATSTRWNATIQPGEDVSFVFLGTAPRGFATPSSFTLNGQECSIG